MDRIEYLRKSPELKQEEGSASSAGDMGGRSFVKLPSLGALRAQGRILLKPQGACSQSNLLMRRGLTMLTPLESREGNRVSRQATQKTKKLLIPKKKLAEDWRFACRNRMPHTFSLNPVQYIIVRSLYALHIKECYSDCHVQRRCKLLLMIFFLPRQDRLYLC